MPLPSCKTCRFFINDRIPFFTKYGYCGLTRQTVPTVIDPVSGDIIVSYNTYQSASLERDITRSCKPEGLLYQHEPNIMKQWYNQQCGTFYTLMMVITYIIIIYIVSLIVAEIIYFM
jgi:hypothetical protein